MAFVVTIKEKFYLVLTEGNISHIPLQSRKRGCYCLFYWGQAGELPARCLWKAISVLEILLRQLKKESIQFCKKLIDTRETNHSQNKRVVAKPGFVTGCSTRNKIHQLKEVDWRKLHIGAKLHDVFVHIPAIISTEAQNILKSCIQRKTQGTTRQLDKEDKKINAML